MNRIITTIIIIIVTVIVTMIATTNYIIKTLEINQIQSNGITIENGLVDITINGQTHSYYFE